jgi:rare lipoprotein A
MKVGGNSGAKAGRKRTYAGLLAMSFGLSVSVAASPTVKREIRPAHAAGVKHHWFQVGTASWYGGKFNGRNTANGEVYDMHAYTCAHRTLPLGTWIRVTNLHNKRVVYIRVNDRGPVSPRFLVDLSYGAAQKLGIEGIGKVKLEPVLPSDPQVAQQLIAQLKLGNDPAVLMPASAEPSRTMLSLVEDR